MRMKRFLPLMASVALAAVLVPGIAWASSLTTSSSPSQDDSAIQTQAAKKTVYVISSWTASAHGLSNEITTPKYYKNGLLKSVDSSGWKNAFRISSFGTYKYSTKGNLKTVKSLSTTTKYKTNSKGQITSEKRYLSNGNLNGSLSYKWKSGKAKSYKGTSWSSSRSGSFTYKNGRVSSIKDGITYKYTYDSRGNLKKFREYLGSTSLRSITWKNTYKSGRLKTSAATASSFTPCKVSYKYKAIKVPASMVSKVKAQQWALVNGNLNLALGGVLTPGVLDSSVFGEG